MTHKEKLDLWNPAYTSHFGHSTAKNAYRGSKLLSKLLQTDEWHKWMYEGNLEPMSDKLKQQLKMLNGPHGNTIFKAFMAQREMTLDDL
jgi:hypothetical protein